MRLFKAIFLGSVAAVWGGGLCCSPDALAGSGQDGSQISQDFGRKMGQFVNAFMRELDRSTDVQEGDVPNRRMDRKLGGALPNRPQDWLGYRSSGRADGARDLYDPWRATEGNQRYHPSPPLPLYDPWGVTRGEQRLIGALADRDWAANRQIYGTGYNGCQGYGFNDGLRFSETAWDPGYGMEPRPYGWPEYGAAPLDSGYGTAPLDSGYGAAPLDWPETSRQAYRGWPQVGYGHDAYGGDAWAGGAAWGR